LAARRLAARLVGSVLLQSRSFDDVLAACLAHPEASVLPARDRAFARLVAATVLRRLGELEHVLDACLEKRPTQSASRQLWPVLLCGAAQLLFLDTAPHAAVSLSVELLRRDRNSRRFAGLANAVLRRVATEGKGRLAEQDGVRLNIPTWLWRRWEATFGAQTARCIAEASLREAPLDISVKPGALERVRAWAEPLGCELLPTGSIRLKARGRIEDLPGYAEGDWWVQDAAAALIARLVAPVAGQTVADLCAAPGGKTAALAAAGAHVTAVDVAPARIELVRANLARLRLEAEIVQADATSWSPGRTFDAVLLDVPCSATGTIRRHPDILRLRRQSDIPKLAALQGRLLRNAARLVRPGGSLVYSACSLDPEEGPAQVDAFLREHRDFERTPVKPLAIGAPEAWFTAEGDLMTLPFYCALASTELPGIDGFYAACLRRRT
jgi:16S rRNA (cytosine967-C5)-methyltransferase